MTTPNLPQGQMLPPKFGDLPAADSQYFGAGSGGHLIISGHGLYLGRSIHCTSGTTPSLCFIRDGSDNNGEIIDICRVNVNVEETVPFAWPGVYFSNGLFVSDASGFAEGVLWFMSY